MWNERDKDNGKYASKCNERRKGTDIMERNMQKKEGLKEKIMHTEVENDKNTAEEESKSKHRETT
jgi:hypothetical protein